MKHNKIVFITMAKQEIWMQMLVDLKQFNYAQASSNIQISYSLSTCIRSPILPYDLILIQMMWFFKAKSF